MKVIICAGDKTERIYKYLSTKSRSSLELYPVNDVLAMLEEVGSTGFTTDKIVVTGHALDKLTEGEELDIAFTHMARLLDNVSTNKEILILNAGEQGRDYEPYFYRFMNMPYGTRFNRDNQIVMSGLEAIISGHLDTVMEENSAAEKETKAYRPADNVNREIRASVPDPGVPTSTEPPKKKGLGGLFGSKKSAVPAASAVDYSDIPDTSTLAAPVNARIVSEQADAVNIPPSMRQSAVANTESAMQQPKPVPASPVNLQVDLTPGIPTVSESQVAEAPNVSLGNPQTFEVTETEIEYWSPKSTVGGSGLDLGAESSKSPAPVVPEFGSLPGVSEPAMVSTPHNQARPVQVNYPSTPASTIEEDEEPEMLSSTSSPPNNPTNAAVVQKELPVQQSSEPPKNKLGGLGGLKKKPTVPTTPVTPQQSGTQGANPVQVGPPDGVHPPLTKQPKSNGLAGKFGKGNKTPASQNMNEGSQPNVQQPSGKMPNKLGIGRKKSPPVTNPLSEGNMYEAPPQQGSPSTPKQHFKLDRNKVDEMARRSRVFTITGNPRAGKSSTVANMAFVAQAVGLRTIVLDLDLYGRGMCLYYPQEINPEENYFTNALSNAMRSPYKADNYVWQITDRLDILGLDLSVGDVATQENTLDGGKLSDLLSAVRTQYELVLIDLPFRYIQKFATAFQQCDRVGYVTENDLSSLVNIVNNIHPDMFASITDYHLFRSRCGFILNRFNPAASMMENQIEPQNLTLFLDQLTDAGDFYKYPVYGTIEQVVNHCRQFDGGTLLAASQGFDSLFFDMLYCFYR